MTHDIRVKRLAYDPDQEIVSAQLTGEMGGRNVELQLRFPFRARQNRSEPDLRKVAILEMQQILRSASNVTLPDISDSAEGRVAPTPPVQSGAASWENEGGAPRAQRAEIVWFDNS